MSEPTEAVVVEKNDDSAEEPTLQTSRRQFFRQAAQLAAGGAAIVALSNTQAAASPFPAYGGPVIDVSGIHAAWINGYRQTFIIEQISGDPNIAGEFRGSNNEFIGRINGEVQGYRSNPISDRNNEMSIRFWVTLPSDTPGRPTFYFEGWVGLRFDSGEILMAGRHVRTDFPGQFPWLTLSHVRV